MFVKYVSNPKMTIASARNQLKSDPAARTKGLDLSYHKNYSCVRITYITWSKLHITTMVIFMYTKKHAFSQIKKKLGAHWDLKKSVFILKFCREKM